MLRAAFQTIVELGYRPEMAYFEVLVGYRMDAHGGRGKWNM